MDIIADFSLRQYNTFGINAIAKQVMMLESAYDFRDAAKAVDTNPFFILGGGSNVVLPDIYDGTILHPVNKGIELVEKRDGNCLVEAAAGEVWADFVECCVANGWYGVENLAGIPGTVGASPVQNVGAYGVEAKDVIEAVHCFEIGSGEERWIGRDECQFAYRWSRFKGEWAGRFIIDRVRFRLSDTFVPNLTYKALASVIDNPSHLTARQLVDTVVSIRDSKLPNPKEIGSAGSFFKNTVVDSESYKRLKEQYPDIEAFPVEGERFKLAAGWLIEQCGWKGRGLGNVGVYEKQALVLVNLGGATGREVELMAKRIVDDVNSKFGVTIEPEAIFVRN